MKQNSTAEVNRKSAVSETDSFTLERYRQMLTLLPAGKLRILDAGCAVGRGGAIMKALRPELEIVGLDCVPERLEKLDPAVYAESICAFPQELSFADKTFDAIVAGELIEHIPPRFVQLSLCEFFRVLKLHGRLILTTPNPHYIKNKLKGLSVLLEDSHVTQHYEAILKHRLRAVGFSKVRSQGCGRVSQILGKRFPLFLYGSYLMHGLKW